MPKIDEALGACLARIARNQLISAAQVPPSEDVVAAGSKSFATLIDEVADRLAGKGVGQNADPAINKLRSFQ